MNGVAGILIRLIGIRVPGRELWRHDECAAIARQQAEIEQAIQRLEEQARLIRRDHADG